MIDLKTLLDLLLSKQNVIFTLRAASHLLTQTHISRSRHLPRLHLLSAFCRLDDLQKLFMLVYAQVGQCRAVPVKWEPHPRIHNDITSFCLQYF